MTYLLISGSRAASPQLLEYARRATWRAIALGWAIFVGDAPGVDHAVAQAVAQWVSTHDHPLTEPPICYIYGLSAQPRHGVTGRGMAYTRLRVGSYAERDQHMLRLADKALCIWNGSSPGTLTVYRAAKAKGLEAWLVQMKA